MGRVPVHRKKCVGQSLEGGEGFGGEETLKGERADTRGKRVEI